MQVFLSATPWLTVIALAVFAAGGFYRVGSPCPKRKGIVILIAVSAVFFLIVLVSYLSTLTGRGHRYTRNCQMLWIGRVS